MSRPVRVLQRLIRWVSVLVPEADRNTWRAEWEAELIHFAEGKPIGRDRTVVLWSRALGALPDALSLRIHAITSADLLGDVRVAARALLKRPLFAGIAILTIGVAIGANTAFFSVFQGVLIRPLPYQNPEGLVRMVGYRQGEEPASGNVSYPNAADWGRLVESLDGVAAWALWRPALADDAGASVLPGATVSWNYFELFGLPPTLGRYFLPDEEGEGRPEVVVISHGLWTRHFGADPNVVGSTVVLNNVPRRIVGVAAREFESPGLGGPGAPERDVWRTPWFDAPEWYRSGRSWRAVARLQTGIPLDVAQAELSSVMNALEELYPDENRGREVLLRPLRDSMVGTTRSALWLMFGAVVAVLLVACANVANLLMGRALDRRREVAVRVALGASRARIVTHLLAESLVLATIGGILGVGLAIVGLDALVALAGDSLPRRGGIGINGQVLLFAGAATLLTGTVFGLGPSLRALGAAGPGGGASSSGRGDSADPGSVRARRRLVKAELALTLVLVVGAALLLRSLDEMSRVDLGIEQAGVLTVELHGSAWFELSPAEAAARYRRVMEDLLAVPGVRAVGATDYVPLDGNFSCDGTARADLPPPLPGEGQCTEVRSVTPGVFEALGVTLRAGRGLRWSDGPDDVRVAVISELTADRYWPEEDPLGGRLVVHSDTFAVVGVVSDVRHLGPQEDFAPHVYLPAQQEPWNGIARGLTLVVRGDGGPALDAASVRQRVLSTLPGLPITAVRGMDDLMVATVGAPRFRTFLLLGFGGTALLLSLIGVGGVMAYSVSQRRREIGVRMAMGAQRQDVLGMILKDGGRIVLGGIGIGLVLAVASGRLLSSFLFGVSPHDPFVLLLAPLGLGATALLACALPAIRAARTEPTEVLRSD